VFQRIGGYDYSPGDGGGNTSWRVNYQHVLSTSRGGHIIDVGAASDKQHWQKHISRVAQHFYSMGRIATGLTAADIYNPAGTSAPASMYAGKFIVFNVPAAKFSDVDPDGVSRYNMIDNYFFRRDAGGNITNNIAPGVSTWLPRMREGYGGNVGNNYSETISYYINDLWSINDHHSVQAGIRFDAFKAFDENTTHHSYVQPTLRFEYKYDIHGDQSRLVTASWAQFHNALPGGTYGALSLQGNANYKDRYWNQGSVQPYLVDYEDIVNTNNYGFVATTSEQPLGVAIIDEDFKAPISTELSVSYRRNLSRGGFWKATYIHRTWENEFDWYPGNVITVKNTDGSDQKRVQRVLRNTSGYERVFNSVEIEWDIPFNKRVNFGGSYTYNRLMSNYPAHTDNSRRDNVSATFNYDWWFDQVVPGGRNTWAPVRAIMPEHYFKWYLLFDLSSGKYQQSLSFNGELTSSPFWSDGYYYNRGLPSNLYPEIVGSPAGGNVPGSENNMMTNSGPLEYTLGTYFTRGNDRWYLDMRYMLTVPLVRKIAWFVTVSVSNPFNHRGLYGWNGDINGSSNNFHLSGANGQRIVPGLVPGNGVVADIQPSDPYGGVWKNNGNVNGAYMRRMDGRSFGVQTGIRF